MEILEFFLNSEKIDSLLKISEFFFSVKNFFSNFSLSWKTSGTPLMFQIFFSVKNFFYNFTWFWKNLGVFCWPDKNSGIFLALWKFFSFFYCSNKFGKPHLCHFITFHQPSKTNISVGWRRNKKQCSMWLTSVISVFFCFIRVVKNTFFCPIFAVSSKKQKIRSSRKHRLCSNQKRPFSSCFPLFLWISTWRNMWAEEEKCHFHADNG